MVGAGGDESPRRFSDDFATLDPRWAANDDQVHVSNNKLILQPHVNATHMLLYGGADWATPTSA